EDGDLGVEGADAAQDLEPGQVREHDVEDDHVGRLALGEADGRVAGHRGLDVPALVAEHGGEQVTEGGLVVDDERPDRGAVRTGERVAQPADGRGGGGHDVIIARGHRYW